MTMNPDPSSRMTQGESNSVMVALARVEERQAYQIRRLEEVIAENQRYRDTINRDMVTKAELEAFKVDYKVVRGIVFGLVAMILAAFVASLIALVMVRR